MLSETASLVSRAQGIPQHHDGFIWAIALAALIATGLMFAVRLWSRFLNSAHDNGIDDFLALAAWPFVFTLNILIMLCVDWGLGIHTDELSDEQYSHTGKLLLGVLLTYYFTMDAIRLSVTFYYMRIFGAKQMFKRFCWANVGLNIAWHIMMTFLAVFQCQDPRAMWDRSITSKCTPEVLPQVCGVTGVVLDLIVLVLPIPLIWNLQMKPEKKRKIIALFVVGYCVPILTFARLVISVKIKDSDVDISWSWAEAMVLFFPLECLLGYFGVCLPALAFMLRRWKGSGFGSLLDKHSAVRSASQKNNMGKSTSSSASTRRLKESHSDTELGTVTDDAWQVTNQRDSVAGIVQTKIYSVAVEERR